MTIDITPCPFCAQAPRTSVVFREIACENPECGVAYTKASSWEDAVRKWNTRKLAAQSETTGALVTPSVSIWTTAGFQALVTAAPTQGLVYSNLCGWVSDIVYPTNYTPATLLAQEQQLRKVYPSTQNFALFLGTATVNDFLSIQNLASLPTLTQT